MKRHIDYLQAMLQSIDPTITFYAIVPPDVNKILETGTVCIISKREDDNILDGEKIFTKYNYRIDFLRKDITSDVLATDEQPGILHKCLKYLAVNPFDEDVLIRAGKGGIDYNYLQYNIYSLYLNITFEDFINSI